MQARMSQRGIPGELVNLVRQYGRGDQGRWILNRKDLRGLLETLRGVERAVIKALDKGGLAVIERDGAMITTFNAATYDKRQAHAR